MTRIIYDSMNKLVWIEGQRKTKGKEGVYGKDAKRFSNNSQARAYAIKLAKEKQGKVYDKYFGKYIPIQKKRESTSTNMFDGDFGFNFKPPKKMFRF